MCSPTCVIHIHWPVERVILNLQGFVLWDSDNGVAPKAEERGTVF